MNRSKISVIIPVFNKEEYIEATLNSVLNQTYKNLEIIIIDDSSIDNSRKICEEKALLDDRIIFVSVPHQGAGAVRNFGLKKATGEYISFIDADDYIIPQYYEVLLNMIQIADADIAECRFQNIESANEKIKEIEKGKETITVLSNEEKLIQLYGYDYDLYTNSVIMCNKLFKHELFKTGILYPTDRLIDDEFIIYKLIYNSKKIVSTNRIMYGYVQSTGSVMRKDLAAQRVHDTLDVYDEVYHFFLGKNIDELECKILLRYLKYCVKLLVKTINSNMENKDEIKEYINKNYQEKWKIVLQKYKNRKEFETCNEVYQRFYKS